MDQKKAMSWFIIIIMILSGVGYVLVDSGEEETIKKYNDFKFIRLQNGWRANINSEKIVFNYIPQQVEDLQITPLEKKNDAIALLQNTPILAVSYDPQSRYAQDLGALQYYLEQTLKGKTRYVQIGLTNNTKYPQLPQITCANASQKLPVIILDANTQLNNTQINYNNSCITALASKIQDAYKITDRLIYIILKVMNQ